MDLSKITDIKELKSLAFDEVQKLNAAQQNLQLLQQRIAQLEEK